MVFVDSHCHLDCLDLSKYEGELDLALVAAKEVGVEYFLCVCIDLHHFPKVHEIAKTHDRVYATVGVHPTEELFHEPTAEELIALAKLPKIIGIGETGLDYYRTDERHWKIQQQRFREHIRAAKRLNKPLIIHSRQASEDTIRLLKEERADTVGGVMHCFTEDWNMAKQAIDLNFYISFSGIVTFNNAKPLQEVAKKVPLEHMLIETDAPYLAPVPFRGQSNEPAWVKFVAEKIAELKKVELDSVAEHTTRNFFHLFVKR